MTDPILHEPSLVDTLDCTCGVDNTSRLQAGALMSLINAYDRQLTRDNFIAIAERALSLHTQMAKMYMMAGTRESYTLHRYDPEEVFEGVLRRTHLDIGLAAQEAHTELQHLTRLVVSCPTSQDKVH